MVTMRCSPSAILRGLAGMAEMGWWLDLKILVVFISLNGSIILSSPPFQWVKNREIGDMTKVPKATLPALSHCHPPILPSPLAAPMCLHGTAPSRSLSDMGSALRCAVVPGKGDDNQACPRLGWPEKLFSSE